MRFLERGSALVSGGQPPIKRNGLIAKVSGLSDEETPSFDCGKPVMGGHRKKEWLWGAYSARTPFEGVDVHRIAATIDPPIECEKKNPGTEENCRGLFAKTDCAPQQGGAC